MGKRLDINDCKGLIVTDHGYVEAPLTEVSSGSRFFICPECKQAPIVAEYPTGTTVYMLCETEGCSNHIRPCDYKATKEALCQPQTD